MYKIIIIIKIKFILYNNNYYNFQNLYNNYNIIIIK